MAKRIVCECDICKRENHYMNIFKKSIFNNSTSNAIKIGAFYICDDCIEEIARKVKGE